jgi:hypothetical protein
MAHAYSTFSVKISRCLRITHAIALALSHALNFTIIPIIKPQSSVCVHSYSSHFVIPLMMSALYARICKSSVRCVIDKPQAAVDVIVFVTGGQARATSTSHD